VKITLNNNETELPTDEISVADLLERQGFSFPMIVVKLNGELIKKKARARTQVRDGDRVDAVHLVSGG
jgi:sulfur carrier protein